MRTDGIRSGIFFTGALLCAFAALLLPIAARSSFDAAGNTHESVARYAIPEMSPDARVPRVEVLRDPFVAPPPPKVIVPGRTPVTLDAIISGPSARALVEEGGRTRVVAPGDPLAGSIVLSIGTAMLQLKDGRRLRLAAVQP